MVNGIWPTAVAGKADIVSSVSASACHIRTYVGGPNSVNPGQILLDYGVNYLQLKLCTCFEVSEESMISGFTRKVKRLLGWSMTKSGAISPGSPR